MVKFLSIDHEQYPDYNTLLLRTYVLTNWFAVSQEIPPPFHGTRRFITALTSVRQLSLSWASPIQSIYPHPTSWRSILVLFTHLRLGLHSGLFPSGFPTKTLYTTLSSPIRTTCPANLILLDFITRTILGEQYKSFSSSLCNLLHCPVTSFLLGSYDHYYTKLRNPLYPRSERQSVQLTCKNARNFYAPYFSVLTVI